jgi:hypothetical protein
MTITTKPCPLHDGPGYKPACNNFMPTAPDRPWCRWCSHDEACHAATRTKKGKKR